MLLKYKIPIAAVGLVALDFIFPQIKKRFINSLQDTNVDVQRRANFQPLKDLECKFREIFFDFYNLQGTRWNGYFFGYSNDNYWIDGAGYQLSEKLFTNLIKTTHELHNMCLEATDIALNDDLLLKEVFDIPKDMFPIIRKSWENRQLDLLSRYDFILGKNGQLYFLEVNGDTPSCIIEAGQAQKLWAEQFQLLQFNNIDFEIKQGLQKIMEQNGKSKLFMLNNSNWEDKCTFNYLHSLIKPFLANISIDTKNISKIENVIENELKSDNFKSSIILKQYPFEWLASESTYNFFTNPQFYDNKSQIMIEPPWKIIMSNKAMSVLLYNMFPQNPHLAKASLEPIRYGGSGIPQVSKQKYGREGDSIILSKYYNDFELFQTDSYKKFSSKPIFQEFIDSDHHQQRYITLSCWVIQGKPCGIVIREDLNPIIGQGSSVVPYYIEKKQSENEQQIQIDLITDTTQSNIRQSLYGKEEFNSNTDLIRLQENIAEKTQYIDPLFQDNLIRQNIQSIKLQEKTMRHFAGYHDYQYQTQTHGTTMFQQSQQNKTTHRQSGGSTGKRFSSSS
ncbi:glutathionylspermidine synthase (macronuclear) [Tetrahymena thermophila SB210]|uniref:Glutathionylspermidine synthase n=1 Tax=Tetrahymena thermophila (strain SB210) TaxID=312017 RepID=I7M117_TETTS|nr:glutathionylspermidine synthase [Tetrahymena thermophila SB210]EAR93848.1 glutathionylspermidine synthase [Tetrahymena thermophila SB210]|eukprot:XP_001014093.1 glutathionylspermidine synthase [Tetrahymena thermophila SB210]